MKHTFFITLFLCFGYASQAQDVIHFKDGRTDTVRLIEITPELITYKKYKWPEGPIFKVYAHTVEKLEYIDGTVDIITALSPIEKEAPRVLKRNIFAGNVLGLFIGNFHVNYEHITKSGDFGFRTHLMNTFLSELTEIYLLAAGLDFNYYPNGQGSVRYFIGPGLRLGRIGDAFDDPYPFGAIILNNGVSFAPSPSFNISLQLGLGAGVAFDEAIPWGFLMLNMGKRF